MIQNTRRLRIAFLAVEPLSTAAHYLGAHLQKPEWKLIVRKGRNEEAEGRIHPFLQLPEEILVRN